jgi:hypothetical protein
MTVAIFWDIASCSQYMNRRFGGLYRLHLQGKKLAEQETFAQQTMWIYIPEDGNVHVRFCLGDLGTVIISENRL